MLSQAILFGASGQIRNMATVGGNIMQRTRCYYFYDEAARCNKRNPGAGCDAIDGFNRIHAILGASEHCIATHPSDMCVALAALDATVHVDGPGGQRTIPFNDFHFLPGETPQIETALQAHELITAIGIAFAAIRQAISVSQGSRSSELCLRASQCSGGARNRGRRRYEACVSRWAASRRSRGGPIGRSGRCRARRRLRKLPPRSRR